MLSKPLKVGDTAYAAPCTYRSWQSGVEVLIEKVGRKNYTAKDRDGTVRTFDFNGNEKSDYPLTLWDSKEANNEYLELNKQRSKLSTQLKNLNTYEMSLDRISEIRQFLGLGE